MAENIVIEFSLPDYVSAGEVFTVEYVATNPIDDQVHIYLTILVGNQPVNYIDFVVDPLSQASGYFTLTASSIPFTFVIKGEAYIDNVLAANGAVEITISERGVSMAVPLMIGLGSMLWGGLIGRQEG